MSEHGLKYFSLLKTKIVEVLQQTYPSVPSAIESWKGQDIVFLQDDLLKKVKGTISEKWFYTHIKIPNTKLPRIDMLNMLSQYVGCSDWNDFKEKNKEENIEIQGETNKLSFFKKKKKQLLIASISLILLVVLYILFWPRTYIFCFYDANQQILLDDQKIEIIILNDGESPIYKRCEAGCFTYKSAKSKLRFVVKTPYYKVDTITRFLSRRDRNEIVKLKPNDYAMMIHFFSKSKIDDWQKRRKQLNLMFTENAQIYQMYGDEEIGIELYNKTEFINKLTMPLRSLENIEIIETVYTGNRISVLKFRQIEKP